MSTTTSPEKIIEELKANRAKRHFTTPVIPSRFHFHVGVDRVLDFLTAENDVLYHLNRKKVRERDGIIADNKISRNYDDIDGDFAREDLIEIHAYVIQLQSIDIDTCLYNHHISKCISFVKEFIQLRSYKLTEEESHTLSIVQDIILNLLLIKDVEFSIEDFIDASILNCSYNYTYNIPASQKYHYLMATKVKKFNYNLDNI